MVDSVRVSHRASLTGRDAKKKPARNVAPGANRQFQFRE
jgi:hypothetical protein